MLLFHKLHLLKYKFQNFPLFYLFLLFRRTTCTKKVHQIIVSSRWVILSCCIYSHPLIKQPIRIRQQIKQEPHVVSVGTQMRYEEVELLFRFFFQGVLSKNQVIHGSTCQRKSTKGYRYFVGTQVKEGFFFQFITESTCIFDPKLGF